MSTSFTSLRLAIARQAKPLRPCIPAWTPLRRTHSGRPFTTSLSTTGLGALRPRDHIRSFSGTTLRREQGASTQPSESETLREQQPAYEMTFTCKKCDTRSTHRISKQGYHKGTVLVQCPGCKNRHLISDHLKIFSDIQITLEDILKEKGQLLKKGELSAEGDVEFWEDGSQTIRKNEQAKDP